MTSDLQRALAEHFGFTAFRGIQEQVIRHVLDGGDALVIMATGEGKSLCYQLPALVQDGLTLVVSPLIALMEDQVRALREKGIAATCIHSMMSAQDRRRRLAATLAGDIRLLYVTPERFRTGTFLQDVLARKVALLAIDEAHCVSHWGHDFRPDYSRLGQVRQQLGNPPTLALTATATPDVQSDITEVLAMPGAALFHTGIERENLYLSVHPIEREEDKLERVLEVLDLIGGPGIVYTALIADLLRLEEKLQAKGYYPLIYHGRLSSSERKDQQRRFGADRDGLILATNAFGMGVDKPDIRFIVHYQMPRTLEAYYQEIGRAGRDGRGSFCELLYFEEDISIQREFTEWANPDFELMTQVVQHLAGLGERLHAVDLDDLRATFLIKNRRDGRIETCLNLLETAGCCRGRLGVDFEWLRAPDPDEIHAWLPADKRQRDLRGLLEMVRYATGEGCRKRTLHRYFGLGDLPADCGACDADTALGPWLDAALPAAERNPVPRHRPPARELDDEVRRGDWIEVQRLGPCHVTRVHRHGNRLRVDVQVARDLSERSFDLRKVRWRPCAHDD